MRQVVTIVGSGVLLAVLACNAGGSNSADSCDEGSKGCDCYPNETCDSGLSCNEELKCEDPSGGPGPSGSGSGGDGSGGGTSSGSGGATSSAGGPKTGSGGDSSSSGGTSTSGSGGTSSGSGGESSTSSGGSSAGGTGGDTSTGGVTSGSGGASNGSGGAPPSGSGGSGGSGGTPVSPGLIDDFSDCDADIPEIEGRNGSWYTFASDETYIESAIGTAPSSSEATWGDQTCGAFINGLCPGCGTAGIGVILNDGVYDLSSYSGIRFTIESAAPVYVAVKTTDGNEYGYAWGAVSYTGVTSATRTVYFADLEPDAAFHGLDRAQEIQFTVDDYGKMYGFRLAVHHLELID